MITPSRPDDQDPLLPRHQHDPEQVRRWLTTVAIELRNAHTRDWRWWRLARHTLTTRQIRLASRLAYGLVAVLVYGLMNVDESIHLASAFQLAGFRHVVASLWPLEDSVAERAAQSFYENLPSTGDAGHAAAALHQVSHDLRNRYPDRADLWAPLIHYGL